MPDMFTGGIEGLPELKKAFSAASDKARRGGLREAVKKAIRPILREAKARVPVRTGLTKKALGSTVSVTNTKATGAVGVRRRSKGRRGSLVHLIEKGTARTRAQPFLRPAIDAAADEAVKVFGASIKEGLERVQQRLGRL